MKKLGIALSVVVALVVVLSFTAPAKVYTVQNSAYSIVDDTIKNKDCSTTKKTECGTTKSDCGSKKSAKKSCCNSKTK